MTELFKKECRLSASKLSFIFIAFGLMTLTPGYPVLMGAFFVCLGIFQSFQTTRENNDIVFSALLPVAKADVVKAKFIFCIFIESCGFALMTALTLVRMTALKDAAFYRENALMNANPFFLGCALLVFGLFNRIFVRGFFRTSYYFAKPFVGFIALTMLTAAAAEAAHHFSAVSWLNAFGFEFFPRQLCCLGAGAGLCILLTAVAIKKSIADFGRTDL